MNTNAKFVIGGILAFLVIVIGGSLLLTTGQAKPIVREEQGVAGMAIDKTTADLGTMTQDEEKNVTFTINNTGNSVLRLWNVKTSCNCTFATIKIGDKEAGEFSMHSGGAIKNWIGEVPVGQSAQLTVIYRPKIMPVVGKVSRQVTFATNDPTNENVEVSIEANVQ